LKIISISAISCIVPAMRRSPVVVFALLLPLFLTTIAPAANLTGASATYVQSRETADKEKILGGREYLDFAVRDIGSKMISFHAGGWLRYDFQEEEFGKKSNSDLQYSYLSFKTRTGNTVVNLGRVMVFEGVAAERVDGLYARTDLAGGFGVSGFGGSPIETSIDSPGNSVIYGARLSHQYSGIYRIGISALKEEKDSADYRKEGGIDIWAHPLDKVDITGTSTYNDISKGWMEHSYVLSLGPFKKLRLDTHASVINYDDYFFRATTNAFSLQALPGFVEPHEKLRTLGEEASYPVTDRVLVAADYKNFTYDIAGKANYYGGKIRYSVSRSGGAGIGYHRMDGETDGLRYNEYRAYGYRKFGKLDVVVDAIDISYAAAIHGVKHAYSASVAARYDLAKAWKLGADVEYSHNPDFDRDVRTFFKLLYSFGEKGGA
jgi:hypothetical protein